MGYSRRIFVLLVLFSLVFPLVTAPAQEASLRERLDWLDAHQGGDREYTLQLRRALSDISDVRQRADTSLRYLDRVPDSSERSSLAMEAGRMYALILDFGSAERALERAVREDGYNQTARLLYAEVLQEVGNPQESIDFLKQTIRRADSVTVQRRAALLLLRAYLLTDARDRAVELAESLTEGSDVHYIGAPTFFLVREVAGRYDVPALYESAATTLSENFPESLEQGLVDSTVLYLPLPSRLLAGYFAATPVQRTAPPQSSPERSVAGIQTGSFRDEENAEYMARDLTSLGFTVDILETAEGYFKVFVPVDEEYPVQETVVRLKERGYEGFLLFTD